MLVILGLPSLGKLVEFRYFSVSFQNYTSATKSEWPGSAKYYWTEQIGEASYTP